MSGVGVPTAPDAALPVVRRARKLFTQFLAGLRLTARSAWRGAIGFYNSDDLTHAASVAYYALLSLFPFFLLVFAVLGSVTEDEAARAAVLRFIFRYFPRQFDFVTTQLDALRRTGFTLGLAGSGLLIWASMGVFGALTSAINHAWGVEKQPSYFKHKLVSLLMLVAASVLLMLALLLISAIQVVEASWFASVLARVEGLNLLRTFAVRSGTTLLLILVVGLIFYFVPNAKVRFRDVWVGAVVTGLLWRLGLSGFQWYVRDLTSFSIIHGSIAAVVVFLLWVYVSSVILLYGVEFTAAFARLRRGRPDEIPAAPSPRA
jgi:membrane protein